MSRRPGIGSDALDSILENFKNGIFSLNVKGNDFSIPIYYSKKIKEILQDTSYLDDYEKRSQMLINNNINKDLILSDLLCEHQVQAYLIENDYYIKSIKKSRLDL